MIEPDEFKGDVGIEFDTLYETDEWVLRQAKDPDLPIQRWLSHWCERGDYNHRHYRPWNPDLWNQQIDLEEPCRACASKAPDGMLALYKLLEAANGS